MSEPLPVHAYGYAAAAGGAHVTGEAVVVELRLAKLPSRSIAEILDIVVQLLLLLAGDWLLGNVLATGDEDVAEVAFRVLTVAVIVGYPLLFEVLSHGRSLGKLALGLRVVRDDGSAEGFRHALVRSLVGVIEIWLTLGVVAVITSLVSPTGKRVGDHLAGTVVVRERVPRSADPTALLAMPPALAGWAATLDLSRLPDPLALAARQLVGRAGSLTPQARWTMSHRLAYEVSLAVSPQPPPGCPPEAYLVAVLAERRRREALRQQLPAGQTPRQPTYAPPSSYSPPSSDPRPSSNPPPVPPVSGTQPAPGGFAPPG